MGLKFRAKDSPGNTDLGVERKTHRRGQSGVGEGAPRKTQQGGEGQKQNASGGRTSTCHLWCCEQGTVFQQVEAMGHSKDVPGSWTNMTKVERQEVSMLSGT